MATDTVTPAAAGARAGTKLFAPQVRLVTEDGDPLTIGTQPVSQDIISAKVTLVNSDVSTVEIVLNNQRHKDDYRPIVPTWRYNDLATVSFGTRMRVDYRYGNDPWTPMILARITDMAFLFPQAAGAQVTLQGEDLLSLLKVKPPIPHIYLDSHEVDIVKEAVDESGSSLVMSEPRPAPLFGAGLWDTTQKTDTTYKQFIDAMAERMDYEVFVDFDPAPTGGAAPAVKMHFEPARSATFDADKTPELKWGRDLLDFKPAFKGWDLLTSAVASGTPPGRRGSFDAEVTMADAINDLHAAPGGATPLSAADARARAFANENRPETNTGRVSVTNLDEERAAMQATAMLRKSARQFLTADITTIGIPGLRPGMHINLTGFYAPFDGIYYVTQTVHSLSAAGYVTVTSLRRPGMLDPSDYPEG